MLVQTLLLLVGLALLLSGGESLVRGASALARRLGLSEVVIGLTVVAFGTSAPELVVSVSAALSGQAGLALGNVVGSNIGNILLILGASAVAGPGLVACSKGENNATAAEPPPVSAERWEATWQAVAERVREEPEDERDGDVDGLRRLGAEFLPGQGLGLVLRP